MLHRLWVGILAAILFGAVAVTAVGHDRLLTAFETLDTAEFVAARPPNVEFTIPDAPPSEVNVEIRAREFFDQFWSTVKLQDPASARNFGIVGICAALAGLVIGVIAWRWTLIFCTALAGTAMVLIGLTWLGQCYWPQLLDQAVSQGRALALAALGFVAISILLQAQLTRRIKLLPAASDKKA